ncbi:MAG TPA: bifunctional methylenetetrahydrofolate dehydrogenase/methenyltetrahydrofolate cyclohydrolase FolD [Clostridiales bacterium]|jgi:methylenetetrahydrofolate dehydrogenase (NADP+)/methenyltetrahydrofolate cyclohydrolase|nr:bifunctional methylenetetrahydrofolate dehydrogenase/methenyltetrahydrofolate cyclohydrolase FolD [Clostridiales bacterium]
MSAFILDGKAIAAAIKQEIKDEIESKNIKCGLAVVLVGDDEASKVYVKNKIKACSQTGIKSYAYYLQPTAEENELLQLIDALNNDSNIHGILVQLPLPSHISPNKVISAINPKKDVDGFCAQNMGKLFLGETDMLAPCTPSGIIEILKRSNIEISGKNAVIVGRSNIVGKPIALMMLRENATVTITHSKTKDLKSITSLADILIVAAGKRELIDASMVKKGAVVVDVGIHRTEQGLKGDVKFDEASKIAQAITPVPGGVGPMTIAMLLKNTLKAAKDLLEIQ